MLRIDNPFPLYLDLRGALLDAGSINIGVAGNDPDIAPLTVYWDAALTQVAEQPLRTRGGMIVNGASPASVWAGADDYSIRVKDADGNLVSFASSAAASGATVSYQPLDADLTTIAAQANTTFGFSLLRQASAAALKALLGIVDGLATTGGTVTGNITRSGGGPHTYHGDATFLSGKITVIANGGADTTTQVGEILLELEA